MAGPAGYDEDDDDDLDGLARLFGGLGKQGPTFSPGGASPGAAVSDDPAISGAAPQVSPTMPTAPAPMVRPPIPTAPTFQGPDMGALSKLRDSIAGASQPVMRADHPASIWQKLLSIPLAAVEGYGNAKQGIEAGNSFLDRNYDRAVEAQKSQLDPLYKQLELQEKMLPFNREANTNSQNTFEDQLKGSEALQKQQESDETQSTRAPEIKTDPDGTEHFWYKTRGGQEYEGAAPPGHENAQRRAEEDKSTPAVGARPEKDPAGGMRVKTKAGGYMPWTAKTVEEGALNGDPNARRMYDEAHRDKSQEEKPATHQQYSKVQTDRDKGWNTAHKEYAKQVELLSPKDTEGLKKAQQDFYDARQQVQDEYEDQINTLGGTAQHTELPRNIFGEEQGTPGAAPSGSKSAPTAQSKTVTKDVVQKYADSHKLTYAQAAKGFQTKQYTIQ